jgi:hypothetical protein
VRGLPLAVSGFKDSDGVIISVPSWAVAEAGFPPAAPALAPGLCGAALQPSPVIVQEGSPQSGMRHFNVENSMNLQAQKSVFGRRAGSSGISTETNSFHSPSAQMMLASGWDRGSAGKLPWACIQTLGSLLSLPQPR